MYKVVICCAKILQKCQNRKLPAFFSTKFLFSPRSALSPFLRLRFLLSSASASSFLPSPFPPFFHLHFLLSLTPFFTPLPVHQKWSESHRLGGLTQTTTGGVTQTTFDALKAPFLGHFRRECFFSPLCPFFRASGVAFRGTDLGRVVHPKVSNSAFSGQTFRFF